VFPHIDRQKGNKSLTDVGWRILIWCLTIFKHAGASVIEKPSPARSLDCGALCVESILELFDTSPLSLDHDSQIALSIRYRTTTFFDWSKSFPKELVVQVPTTIEFYCVGEFNVPLNISGCESFCRLHIQSVKIVYVGSMMFAVVEFHQLAAYNWFKRAQLVRQVLQLGN
jgi:hypothetical protein